MYRCSGCDAPAMMNCGCHTQVELPTDNAANDARYGDDIVVAGVRFRGEDKTIQPQRKINISSGEDAMLYHVECA